MTRLYFAWTIILISTLQLFFTSCDKINCNCEINQIIIQQNDSLITALIKKYSDSMTEYWKRFNEPVLFKQDVETYRFSITVLLADYQKIYRIEKRGENAQLYVKEYAVSTTTAFRQDSLVISTSRDLTKLEWDNLKKELNDNCFWTILVDNKKMVLDGSSWVLEGFNPEGNNCTNSNYHYAHRASPDSSAFKNISNYIMALDSLKVKEF